MIIYYTEEYSGGRGESHRLLELAVSDHIKDSGRAGTLITEMRTGKMGKPYIDGFDCFSISHTENVWAVLFCVRECGLDIQRRTNSDILSIANRFYSPSDAGIIISKYQSDPDRARDEFFRIWARREALIKAAGSTVADSTVPAVSPGEVMYEDRRYGIYDISIPGVGHLSAAVCIEGGFPSVERDIEFRRLIMAGDRYDRKKNRNKTAHETAYAYLSARMRTVSEVRKYLGSRGYGEEEITETINELIGLRYLDDYLYALRYYEYNREKKRGVRRAERELTEKGIDRETARNAREDFLYENDIDEFSDALEIALKEVYEPADTYGAEPVLKDTDEKLTARIARKLEAKGFGRSDIFRVIEEIRHLGNS